MVHVSSSMYRRLRAEGRARVAITAPAHWYGHHGYFLQHSEDSVTDQELARGVLYVLMMVIVTL
jgi:hypothetical protein